MSNNSADNNNNNATADGKNIIQLMHQWAEKYPQKRALTFISQFNSQAESEQPFSEVYYSYSHLFQRAKAIGAKLQSMGAEGKRVLLLYPAGLEFTEAFLGCLFAGAVPVPTVLPRPRYIDKVRAIVEDADIGIIFSEKDLIPQFKKVAAENNIFLDMRWMTSSDIDTNWQEQWVEPEINVQTLAFLQYTSGSTGVPKGVMVSHGNLINNEVQIQKIWDHTEDHVIVCWTPLYHDMGLISSFLQAIYIGAHCVLMNPTDFVQNPLSWLVAIEYYRATTSGGPNFGYDLCVERVTEQELRSLDLSRWQIAVTGSEPIRVQTLRDFCDKFSPCGFKFEAFYPCYGMAESTLFITGGAYRQAPIIEQLNAQALEEHKAIQCESHGRELVACGFPWLNHQLKIVDPESFTECTDGAVGEIWFSGDSVAQGYWQNIEATRETFQATMNSEDNSSGSDERHYLRTGDLGYLRNGQLYVTGRIKDVVIVHGQNHYPQDIEYSVQQSDPSLRPEFGAAFSITVDGHEHLAVVQEVKRTHMRRINAEEVIGNIRQAIAQNHQLQVHTIQLLRTGSVPKTSSGKIQRRLCKDMCLEKKFKVVAEYGLSTDEQKNAEADFPPAYETLKSWMCTALSERCHIPIEQIDTHQPFSFFGLSSVALVGLVGELEKAFNIKVAAVNAYDYPSIDALATYLTSEDERPLPVQNKSSAANAVTDDIAIVGMACRFPQAQNLDEFWDLLRHGKNGISEVSAEREALSATAWSEEVRRAGFIDDADQFDAGFFNITPREAQDMDPQQRIVLQTSWHALEHAGLHEKLWRNKKGSVFFGGSSWDYERIRQNYNDSVTEYFGTGTSLSVIANRLSYFLAWNGPSMLVDTACSSSLVALHQACKSLRDGESDIALSGGVNLILAPEISMGLKRANMLGEGSQCRTFDAMADGYVRGEGCAAVVLKRLSDARADGDRVLAVIKGSAVNQDGVSNGLTAPNGLSQRRLLSESLLNAQKKAADIGYIEAHGTGTVLGDPIEFSALDSIFGKSDESNAPCYLGSVKTNIGHLEPAAGIAGLIKVVLSLQHKWIPAHLNFTEPNPDINLESSRLAISAAGCAWESKGAARCAGVSSFGFGGTNAHVVVEEAPEQSQANTNLHPFPLLVSAQSKAALDAQLKNYLQIIESENDEDKIRQLCIGAAAKRQTFRHRFACSVRSIDELRQSLTRLDSNYATVDPVQQCRVALQIGGEGLQQMSMFRHLLDHHPVFARELQICDEQFQSLGMASLLSLVPTEKEIQESPDVSVLTQSHYGPALAFAFDYALLKLWQSWGVEAHLYITRGLGTLVSTCVAGAISLADACCLVEPLSKALAASSSKKPGGNDSIIKSLIGEFSHALQSIQFSVASNPVLNVNGVTVQLKGFDELDFWIPQASNAELTEATNKAIEKQHLEVLIDLNIASIKPLENSYPDEWRDAKVLIEADRNSEDDNDIIQGMISRAFLSGVAIMPHGSMCDSLPNYVFQTKSHWLQAEKKSQDLFQLGSDVQSLVGGRLPAQARQGDTVVWQTPLTQDKFPFVDDHRIQGAVVMPGVMYQEFARAAIAELHAKTEITLSHVRYHAMLFIPEKGDQVLQTHLKSLGDGHYRFYIHSGNSKQSADEQMWPLHASGEICVVEEQVKLEEAIS